jgi:hypothetical protein
MSRKATAICLASAAAGLIASLALAGPTRGIALLVCVFLVGAVVSALFVRYLRVALPRAPRFERLLTARRERAPRLGQLDAIERRLMLAETSPLDLHFRLRPLVREIVAARLSRRYGLDLDREPQRARALVGARTWELVRPERLPSDERSARGWSKVELAELLDEMEAR